MTTRSTKDENSPLSIVAFQSFVAEYKSAQDAIRQQNANTIKWSIGTCVAVSSYTFITLLLLSVGYNTWQTEKTAFYYSQRASVILSGLQVLPLGPPTPPGEQNKAVVAYDIIPQWENAGNTYASSVTTNTNFQFSHEDLANGFTAADGGSKPEGPSALGPKEISNYAGFRSPDGAAFYFPHGCLLDLSQNKFRYAYVWGWAKYKDIIRPDEERVTRFCRRIFGTLTVKNEIQFNYTLCDEGNCQDEECTEYKYMHAPKMPSLEFCQPIAIANPPEPPPATKSPM